MPADQAIRALVNGEERQNYAVSDMIFSPLVLVSFFVQVSDFAPW